MFTQLKLLRLKIFAFQEIYRTIETEKEKNMKKIIALALTFSIILSMSINSFAYSDSPKSVDVSGMTLYSVSEEVIYVENGVTVVPY